VASDSIYKARYSHRANRGDNSITEFKEAEHESDSNLRSDTINVRPDAGPQRKQSAIVQRTFVPDEPLPCIAFNRMATRLDAVYKIDEISKSEYDEGMRKYRNGTLEEDVDYFIGGKDKYQRISLQRDKLAEFHSLVRSGGRARANGRSQHPVLYGIRGERRKIRGIYNLRQLQDAMTLARAEGLLADVAMEGQNW